MNLSLPMDEALRKLAGRKRRHFYVGPATYRALERRGLVEWTYDGTGGWQLTDLGRSKARKLVEL